MIVRVAMKSATARRNQRLQLAVLAVLLSARASGQVVFDGSLPGTTAGGLAAVNGTYTIGESRGFVAGNNLFHSFDTFNVGIGEAAVFQSADAIRHVLARVTGGTPSFIEGRLAAENPNITSFWLVNPSGLLISSTATIDIPGAVAFGTADQVQFADGSMWASSGVGGASAVTLIVDPVDFGFLPATTAEGLVVQGQNFLPHGSDRIAGAAGTAPVSWLLSGGAFTEVTSTGALTLNGGRVSSNIASNVVGDGGLEIRASGALSLNNTFVSTFSTGAVPAGDIELNGGSVAIDQSTIVSAALLSDTGQIFIESPTILLTNSQVTSVTPGTGAAGPIGIGDALFRAGSTLRIANSAIAAGTLGSGAAGSLSLASETVDVNGGTLASVTQGVGDAGNINVYGVNTTLSGVNVLTATSGAGSAGGVFFNDSLVDEPLIAGSSIALRGTSIRSSTVGSGSGGDISIRSSNVTLDGASVIASEAGQAGSPNSLGTSGSISIDAGSVLVSGGSSIFSSNFGGGAAGNIFVFAQQHLDVVGGSSVLSAAQGNGAAGNIFLIGPSVSLNGSRVASSSSGASLAGSIFLADQGLSTPTAGSHLSIAGSSIESSATGGGNSGLIRLNADQVDISANSVLTSRTADRGDAGDIRMTANDARITNSQVTSQVGGEGITGPNVTGAGGDIRMDVADLTVSNSEISSRNFGSNAAGNLFMTATGRLALDSNSRLISDTRGAGSSGSILVLANEVGLTDSRVVSGNSGAGNGSVGDILISASDLELTRSTVQSSTAGAGDAGGIILEANTLAGEGSTVISSTSGSGNAGLISIGSFPTDANFNPLPEANNSLITLNNTRVSSNTSGSGAGGGLLVQAARVNVTGGSVLESRATSSGSAGAVGVGSSLTTGEPVAGTILTVSNSSIATSTTAEGDAAGLTIQAGTVDISGSNLLSGSTGSGIAGRIGLSSSRIRLANSTLSTSSNNASIAGGMAIGTRLLVPDPTFDPGSSLEIDNTTLSSDTSGSGAAGLIIAKVDRVDVRNGSRLRSSTTGTGAGGNITLSSGVITIDGSELSSSTSGPGAAGVIDLRGGVGVTLRNATVGTNSTTAGSGNGGPVFINAGSAGITAEGSRITTGTVSSAGGSIAIDAGGGPVTLTNSTILASAGADGDGGDIAIVNAGRTLLRSSGVLAQAAGGNGGDINIRIIDGNLFLPDSASLVSADSQLGINGQITINSPNTDLNAAVQPQDVDVGRPPQLAADTCTPARANDRSTLVQESRGGVAYRPEGYLASLPGAAAAAVAHDYEQNDEVARLAAASDASVCR